jgi:hypothetical protein
MPYLEHLILDDPTAPELGIYITIVGDKHDRDEMGGAITNVRSVARHQPSAWPLSSVLLHRTVRDSKHEIDTDQ